MHHVISVSFLTLVGGAVFPRHVFPPAHLAHTRTCRVSAPQAAYTIGSELDCKPVPDLVLRQKTVTLVRHALSVGGVKPPQNGRTVSTRQMQLDWISYSMFSRPVLCVVRRICSSLHGVGNAPVQRKAINRLHRDCCQLQYFSCKLSVMHNRPSLCMVSCI